GRRIEGPVLAALLSGTQELLALADGEERGPLAEVVVGTGRLRAVVSISEEGDAVDGPGVEGQGARRPADGSGAEVERNDRIEVIVGRDALPGHCRIATRGRHAGLCGRRNAVVVPRRHVELPSSWVDGRRAAPDRSTGVPLRNHVRLPENGPALEVERGHAAPERAAGVKTTGDT